MYSGTGFDGKLKLIFRSFSNSMLIVHVGCVGHVPYECFLFVFLLVNPPIFPSNPCKVL